jgi:hypothetical protein
MSIPFQRAPNHSRAQRQPPHRSRARHTHRRRRTPGRRHSLRRHCRRAARQGRRPRRAARAPAAAGRGAAAARGSCAPRGCARAPRGCGWRRCARAPRPQHGVTLHRWACHRMGSRAMQAWPACWLSWPQQVRCIAGTLHSISAALLGGAPHAVVQLAVDFGQCVALRVICAGERRKHGTMSK